MRWFSLVNQGTVGRNAPIGPSSNPLGDLSVEGAGPFEQVAWVLAPVTVGRGNLVADPRVVVVGGALLDW